MSAVHLTGAQAPRTASLICGDLYPALTRHLTSLDALQLLGWRKKVGWRSAKCSSLEDRLRALSQQSGRVHSKRRQYLSLQLGPFVIQIFRDVCSFLWEITKLVADSRDRFRGWWNFLSDISRKSGACQRRCRTCPDFHPPSTVSSFLDFGAGYGILICFIFIASF